MASAVRDPVRVMMKLTVCFVRIVAEKAENISTIWIFLPEVMGDDLLLLTNDKICLGLPIDVC